MVRLLRPKEESGPESNGRSPMARDRPPPHLNNDDRHLAPGDNRECRDPRNTRGLRSRLGDKCIDHHRSGIYVQRPGRIAHRWDRFVRPTAAVRMHATGR